MTRGIVLPLTAQQRVTRMKWLAQQVALDALDSYATGYHVAGYEHDRDRCCDGYYLLKDHNGGKDPTAIDPFDRWTKDGGTTINRTADCIGGMVWCGGFDRYQPKRFDHLYDGWINTDSMLMDARGPAKCFRLLKQPELGCFVVFASGSGGHAIGHIGGVISAPDVWHNDDASWKALRTVDMAARSGPGNREGNPAVWRAAGAAFVVSTMTP